MRVPRLVGRPRSGKPGRGKSALRRARCRATPGMGQPAGEGHRDIPPALHGKGEKVVQETTGASSNGDGQVTPSGSKAKQEQIHLDGGRLLVSSPLGDSSG